MPGTTVIGTTYSDNEPQPIHYNAYGYVSTNKTCASRLLYNGELFLNGIYLLGLGYRAYSPTLMRFYSADEHSPFGDGGLNAYVYCLGDPVNWVDPSGRGRGKPRVAHVPKTPSHTTKTTSKSFTTTPKEYSPPKPSTSSTAGQKSYNSSRPNQQRYLNSTSATGSRDPLRATRGKPKITEAEAEALHIWNKHDVKEKQGLTTEKTQLVLFTIITSRRGGENETNNIRRLGFNLKHAQIADFARDINHQISAIRKANQRT
jgi:RHS repeat-associated protein